MEIVHYWDLSPKLITEGLQFKQEIARNVALLLAPLFKVALEPWM